jgi:hypothetical protein
MVSDNGHIADVDLFCQLYESHRFFVDYSSYMSQQPKQLQGFILLYLYV